MHINKRTSRKWARMSPTGWFVPAVPGQGFKRRPHEIVTTSQTSRCSPRRPNSKDSWDPPSIPPFICCCGRLSCILHIFGRGHKRGDAVVVKDGGANARLGTLSLTNTVGPLCDIMTTHSHLLKGSKGSEGLLVLLLSSSADYGQILVLWVLNNIGTFTLIGDTIP